MKGLNKLTVVNVICRLTLVQREPQFQTHFNSVIDCKLLRRCCQILESSGMWCCVDWQTAADVWKHAGAFVLTAGQIEGSSHRSPTQNVHFTDCFELGEECTIMNSSVSNYLTKRLQYSFLHTWFKGRVQQEV